MPRISSSLDPWKTEGYVTYRRFWLDSHLNEFSSEMRGKVMDLGGKRDNKRGTFSPPEERMQSSSVANWTGGQACV